MKRASGSTALALMMLLLVGSFASAGTGQGLAVVSTLSGDVSVTRAGGSSPLKFKAEALPGDIIRTADQSSVRLLLRDKALMTVEQRSVLTLGEEEGNLTVKLETGQIGVSVADRRLRPGEALQIETPNVQAAFGRGNIIVNAGKISSGVKTTVYVVDGSVEISVGSTAPRRSVKIEAPRKLTVVGKALGSTQPLSAAESAKLLAELRATSSQHLNAPPPEVERIIVRHGKTEAAKEAKLVAKQVRQGCGDTQGPESSCNRPRPETRTGFDTGKAASPESGPKAETGGVPDPPPPSPGSLGATVPHSTTFSIPLSKIQTGPGVDPGQKDLLQRTQSPVGTQQAIRPQAVPPPLLPSRVHAP